SVTFASSLYQGSIIITGKSNNGTFITLSSNAKGTSNGTITSISGFGNTTILGWYNTTFTVSKVIPALYGLSAMEGKAELFANVSIKNYSHSLSIDPYYQGMQNVSTFVIPILSITSGYNNITFSANDKSQNLTIVGNGGYLNNLQISGTMSITDPIYNLTEKLALKFGASKMLFNSPYTWSTLNISFVSGDVPISYNSSSSTVTITVSTLPIENLTLIPTVSFSMNMEIWVYNYSYTFKIYSSSITATYTGPLAISNSVFQFSSEGSGMATVYAEVQNSYITLQGNVNGITFTTSNVIDVLNVGSIPVSGLTTSQHGSGTLSGILNISKIYPVNYTGNMPSNVILSGQLILQGFYANGTQYYIKVDLMNTVVAQSLLMGITTPINANFNSTFYSEVPNTGISPAITYPLLNGSGAMIVNISNQQIAEIATLTGQYVNISIAQLNAHINSVWSTVNATYAEISTDYGNMIMMLNSMNSEIIALNGTVVTIQTAIGSIQTNISNINAQITGINGNIATINTAIGTIQTTLSSINAQITGINGNIATINTAIGTIQTTLSSINAQITGINGNIVTIQTAIGSIQTNISNINAQITGINGNIATINTAIGTIQTTLSSINAQITGINGNIVTIQTSLGTIKTSLNSINTTVTSTASSVNSLVGSVATIQTSLGTISGTITSVNNGVATIQTQLGAIQKNVSEVKITSSSTSSSVGTTLGWEVGVLILVIMTLVLVLIVVLQVNKISKQFKSKEEKKEGQ
ncbi:MAG: beta strand repeat-containing protein, partial [Thermoplasmata archaeon]